MIINVEVGKIELTRIFESVSLQQLGFEQIGNAKRLYIGPNLTQQQVAALRRAIEKASSQRLVFKTLQMSEEDYTRYLDVVWRGIGMVHSVERGGFNPRAIRIWLITEEDRWLEVERIVRARKQVGRPKNKGSI